MPHRLLLACAAAAALVVSGCGSAAGVSDPASDGAPHTPLPSQGGAPATLIGRGAQFAAPDTALYLASPGTGGSWERINAARERMWPFKSALQGPGTEMRVVLGGLLAFPPGTTSLHGLGREGAMWLGSTHPIHGYVPDLLFYGPVTDRSQAEPWVTRGGQLHQVAPDGDYHVWVGPNQAIAISRSDCVWGTSEREVRAALNRARSHAPSLADDAEFRGAMSRVDGSGAAIIGFSRSNIASELNLAGYGQDARPEFAAASAAFGFHAMAFTVAGRPDGALVRGFPSSGVYRPVDPFRPLLLSLPSGNPQVVVDTRDAVGLLPAVNAFIRSLQAVDGESQKAFDAAGELQSMFHLDQSQLSALLHGEQIAWLSPAGTGFGVENGDPDAAESALRAWQGHDGFERPGASVHRAGAVVWAESQEPDREPVPGHAALTQAIEDSGMPAQVSLLAFVDTGAAANFQDSADSADPKGEHQRYLLWTLPRPQGWEWDLFVSPSAG